MWSTIDSQTNSLQEIKCLNLHSAFFLFPCFQLLLKAQTSSMFKGKKENYPFSVCRPFMDTRIGKTAELLSLSVLTRIYNLALLLLSTLYCTYNMIKIIVILVCGDCKCLHYIRLDVFKVQVCILNLKKAFPDCKRSATVSFHLQIK